MSEIVFPVRDLGLIDYEEALKIQRAQVQSQINCILICEHPPVITLGRGRQSMSDVLTKNLPIVEVERGGRATLHVPGQIVVYPILNLKKLGLDQVMLLRLLEKTIIQTLADFRIIAHTIEKETGVWVDDVGDGECKIASLGIAVKNEMSLHGLAINVCCDMKLFQNLKPCGFNPDVMTSMKDELPAGYWETWKLSNQSLMSRVRLRVAENLINSLENFQIKCLDPVLTEEIDY